MVSIRTKFMLLFKKMYTIDDLKNENITYENNTEIKEKCKIVIIDDENFPKLENLRARNFNISKRDDIHDIHDLEQYDIIITDIRGVGSRFGGELEGGAIVKEVKRAFPGKYVIIYSASQFDSRMNKIFHLADDILKKDDDIETWVDCINGMIDNITDLKKCWIRYRVRLNELAISSRDMAYIEHLYVGSIIDRKNRFEGENIKNENIKPIIQSLVASYIFKFLQISSVA